MKDKCIQNLRDPRVQVLPKGVYCVYTLDETFGANPLMQKLEQPPLYRQLIQSLVDRIRRRELKAHERVPSIRQFAREHKVSEITARRCIDELVKAGTLYTRQGIGTFVAETAADSVLEQAEVKLKRAAIIGFQGEGGGSVSSYGRMAMGIREAAGELGVEVYRSSVRKVNRNGGVASYLDANGLQGVVLFGVTDAAYIRQVASVAPTVVLDTWLEDDELDYVVVDNVPGAYRLTKHLLGLGHKRIAYVGCPRIGIEGPDESSRTDPDSHERLAGYRIALEEVGVPLDEQFIYSNDKGEERTVEEILGRSPLPTALFAFTRSVALGLKEMLEARGVRVPEDMSLVTFSADPDCLSGNYPLTCVHVDACRLGRLAVRRLAERVRSDAPDGMKLAVPGVFVEGRSVARPRADASC